ncbi:hypothetical protein LTR17_002389 [Elasticomyces elasticus]|nr:hypothetical protein LTR17_002389 [Elasticomyces elasticus]
MVVPFGIGVGDFLDVIAIVHKIVKALGDAHGAAAHYRAIIDVLTSLEDALQHLKRLDYQDRALADSLCAATARLKTTLQRFNGKLKRYSPTLEINSSEHKWSKAVSKIRWTFFEKEDVNKFQAEILEHASGILILLQSANMITKIERQMASGALILADLQDTQAKLYVALIQFADELRLLFAGLFSALCLLHRHFARNIPPQITFEDPVTFQDACGRFFRMQLEWFRCWEDFEEMLRRIHRGRPGLSAVTTNQYRLQDATIAGTWSEIDTAFTFEQAFRPRSRIDMAVVFPWDPDYTAGCPRCGQSEDNMQSLARIEWSVNSSPDLSVADHCQLCYSKASYDATDIISYPGHFVLPTVQFEEDPESAGEGPPSVDTDTVADPAPDTFDPATVGMCGNDTPIDPQDSTDGLEDFHNVYIAKPPPVLVKCHEGAWYIFPWRVFQSVEGASFLLHHFASSTFELHTLKDMTLNRYIDKDQWNMYHVYAGMMVTLEARTTHTAASRTVPVTSRQPTRCAVCRKVCYSTATLTKHVKSHLRRKPCPEQCDLCLKEPPTAWDCELGCVCGPNHTNLHDALLKRSNSKSVGHTRSSSSQAEDHTS